MNYSNVLSVQWANAEHTAINCMVNFDDLREELVPFTAVAQGDYPHSHEIFARCVAGDFGAITEYVPPALPTIEELAIGIRNQRNFLLLQSDWTQLPDVPQATKDLWATYRQALRDITAQDGFPQTVTFPAEP
jgi:hypothetical protein